MSHTLEQVRATHAKPKAAATAAAPDSGTPMYHRPYGVVVVSSARGEPKFVFAYDTEAEAEAERVRRQAAEDARRAEQVARRRFARDQELREHNKENRRRAALGYPEHPEPPAKPEPPTFTFYVAEKPAGGWR